MIAPEADREPRYTAINRSLSTAIASGALPPGTVLTEQPLAKLFGTSRTPVRTALNSLLDRGSLVRFDGRGFIVSGSSKPVRLRLTHDLLGLNESLLRADPQPVTSVRIAREFEDALANALPFGLWRISEQDAADHFGVSRTVIRELLSRFQDRGLLRKDRRSHWVVGPLTARDIAHYYAVRGKLEPLALLDSAPKVDPSMIEAMIQRLETITFDDDSLALEKVAEAEQDLHVRLLSESSNPHLLRMIQQSQIALVVNRVFASVVGTRPFDIALREHAMIFEFVKRGAWEAAAQILEEHLALSAERTRQRLMAFSVFPEPSLPRYLKRQQY